MSWSLSASGHADNPGDEKALAAALGQALAGQTVSYASFSGSGFSGDPRELAAAAVSPDPLAPQGPAEGSGL